MTVNLKIEALGETIRFFVCKECDQMAQGRAMALVDEIGDRGTLHFCQVRHAECSNSMLIGTKPRYEDFDP